jgi:hypothetical protein
MIYIIPQHTPSSENLLGLKLTYIHITLCLIFIK